MIRSWRLTTGLDKPLSLNDRQSWMARARVTRQVRTTVAAAARVQQIRPQPHIHVQLEYVPKDARRRDTDNLWLTAKPAIDALVDAGILPNDGAGYVLAWTATRDHDKSFPRVSVTITDKGRP